MRKKLPKLLITGGAGFIGSEFVRQGVRLGYPVVALDKLTYAGDLERFKGVRRKLTFYKADITNKCSLEAIFKKEKPTFVVHFAAYTHVDKSILKATPFIEANIKGTYMVLEISRKQKIEKFIHISTDEVYGTLACKGSFRESSALNPNSPYSVSKAAADMLVKAYVRTYGFPAVIARPCNNYGPWQYPEKLVPVVIYKALMNEAVPVYGRGENIREWLNVSDCARAIFLVMDKGIIGEAYNIGSGRELPNIEVVKKILRLLGKPQNLITFVQDRPGHDFRYSLNFEAYLKV